MQMMMMMMLVCFSPYYGAGDPGVRPESEYMLPLIVRDKAACAPQGQCQSFTEQVRGRACNRA